VRGKLVFGLIFLLFVFGIFPDQPSQDPISRHRFYILGWTINQGLSKTWNKVTIAVPQDTVERRKILRAYFLRGEAVPQELAEEIIAKEIEETLGSHGISFPPVLIKISPPPTLLVISPRWEIKAVETIILNPGISDSQREEIESFITAKKPAYSALVVDLGGLALLPAVVNRYTLAQTIEAAAHEWCHHYLSLAPLGKNYGSLKTLNENVCVLVGRELADEILGKYELTTVAHPTAESSQLNFNEEMRKIRKKVDGLLSIGEVEQAEVFMEEQRQFLSQYFPIRKLNQAYFAFYGSYDDGAAGGDPTTAQVAQIRAKSAGLKEFLEKIRQVGNSEDFRKLFHQEGLPPSPDDRV